MKNTILNFLVPVLNQNLLATQEKTATTSLFWMSLEVNHQYCRYCLSLAQAHDFILSNSVFPKLGIFTKDVFQEKKKVCVNIFIVV